MLGLLLPLHCLKCIPQQYKHNPLGLLIYVSLFYSFSWYECTILYSCLDDLIFKEEIHAFHPCHPPLLESTLDIHLNHDGDVWFQVYTMLSHPGVFSTLDSILRCISTLETLLQVPSLVYFYLNRMVLLIALSFFIFI